MTSFKRLQTAREIYKLSVRMANLIDQGRDKQGQEKREYIREIADVKHEIDKLRASDGG
jgi:hypothetical protein